VKKELWWPYVWSSFLLVIKYCQFSSLLEQDFITHWCSVHHLEAWGLWCCILGGPGEEHIMDVVPRGTELELQLRRGVGQAPHTCSSPHIKCTGVY
jgi:hypothetical protein